MQKILYLPEVDSTNRWAKDNLSQLLPCGAVFTTSQTAGRGRLGRQWANAAGQGLYYTVVYSQPMVQPSTLPLFASMAAAEAIQQVFGAPAQIKWPNDLLVNGKKVVGILCEGTHGCIVCGIGTNLSQPQSYFDNAGLPHGTSLQLQGYQAQGEDCARALAMVMSETLTGADYERFAAEGIRPFLQRYTAACVNIGRHVTFDGGSGVCSRIDEEGRLVVQTDAGQAAVLSGEVSVKGIYGAV